MTTSYVDYEKGPVQSGVNLILPLAGAVLGRPLLHGPDGLDPVQHVPAELGQALLLEPQGLLRPPARRHRRHAGQTAQHADSKDVFTLQRK